MCLLARAKTKAVCVCWLGINQSSVCLLARDKTRAVCVCWLGLRPGLCVFVGYG